MGDNNQLEVVVQLGAQPACIVVRTPCCIFTAESSRNVITQAIHLFNWKICSPHTELKFAWLTLAVWNVIDHRTDEIANMRMAMLEMGGDMLQGCSVVKILNV